jgi:conjugal transfer pilus assembly protein TraE
MKKEHLNIGLGRVLFQRNIFVFISVLLSATLLLLSCFLFFKKERIVITPAVIEKAFWVEGNTVSPTYLEQMGVFFGNLLLGKTHYSASAQRAVLLRHASPLFFGDLRAKLIEEEEKLKKQNASYVFFPVTVDVNVVESKVTLVGDRTFYVAGKKFSSSRETYELSFVNVGSQLMLDGISSKGEG